jgi:PTH1 family peptidyl-tRNA hydrolase
VAPLVRWAGIEPQDLMVVYDDLDLPVGGLRLRPGGGHGGQNGMRSIIDCLGTNAFPRLRVGIGRPSTDAARHVLSPFSPEERVEADISVAEAAEAALAWLGGEDLESVMTRFHSRWSTG